MKPPAATANVPPPIAPAVLAGAVELESLAASPDGREIAFTSDRSGAFELWTLELQDPGAAPRRRTSLHEHVTGLSYSQDGTQLVFESDHGGDERPDLWLLRRGAAAPEQLTKTPEAEHGARFSPDGKCLVYESDPATPFHFDLVEMDLATRKTEPLTHSHHNLGAPRFSRDGGVIAAARSADDIRGDLVLFDRKSKALRTIAAPVPDGIARPVGFLPDGRLLVRATDGGGVLQPAAIDVATGAVTWLCRSPLEVDAAEVAADGTIVLSKSLNGMSLIEIAAPPYAQPTSLALKGTLDALAVAGTRIDFISESSALPATLRSVDRTGKDAALRIAAEAPGVSFSRLAQAEWRLFKSFDGAVITAWLVKPPIARLGSPPPLIIQVHGGPESEARDAWNPLIQSLAEAGFAVVSPNYRGSSGHGRAFQDLNDKDWGGGDLKDLLAVVSGLSTSHEIDPDRAGITGGSYGGYLTLRALTAAPAVFGAGVEMYGMADLALDYRLSADRFAGWYETEMGNPEKDAALFHDRSPIHFLDRIKAPLLVLQGANDTNVPRAESDDVVAALTARHHPVEYVVYPDEGHAFFKRKNRVDAMQRTVEFFLKYIGRRRSP